MSEPEDPTQRPLESLAIDLAAFTSGRVNEIVSGGNVYIGIGASSHNEKFCEEAKREELQGNIALADTFHVLSLVCGFSFHSGSVKQPFGPILQQGNMRSPIPEDFTEEQISRLDEATAHITDPDLLARISDVIWVKLRRHQTVRRAIDAYLEAAKDSRYMEGVRFQRLERAFRLAKSINAKDKWQQCEKVFAEFKETPVLFTVLAIDLFSLAHTFQILDPKTMAEEARAIARTVIDQDPIQAESLLLIAAECFKQIGDQASAMDCNRKIADGFLAIANKADALMATDFIERSIEALKRASPSKEEIQKLNLLHIKKGKESISQMKRVEGAPVDFGDPIKAAKKLVEGLAPNIALQRVALQFQDFHDNSYAEHKDRVEKSIQEHPLMHFIGSKSISREGRQYSRRPSFMTDDPKEQKLALETEIAHSMALHQQAATKFGLIHALSEIAWSTKDLTELFNTISYRPFVPPGRGQIIFQGIRAGLEGDFLHAAHVLVPQLENSLRFLLEARGLSVVTHDKNGIHTEMSLNVIFEKYPKELTELLSSEDLMNVVRLFLCERAGENFRNEIAHGLIENVLDWRLAFAWWLFVYLLYRFQFPETPESSEGA